MADLVEEIKEDIKHEKYAKLWQDLRNYVIGGIIVVVLATAGFVWWKDYSVGKYEEQGSKLYNVFAAEDGDAASTVAEYSGLSSEVAPVYSAMADLRRAGLLVIDGKKDEAVAIYKELSEKHDAPAEIKQLAELFYLQNAVNSNVDDKILAKLQKVADSDGIYKYSAKELLAITKYKAGKRDEAKKIFEELSSDVYVPARMKGRAVEMIDVIN